MPTTAAWQRPWHLQRAHSLYSALPPQNTFACRGQLTQHSETRRFSQADVDAFVALTGDANPIHSPASKAPIVPGLLAASLFPAIIGSRHPGVLYTRQELKFVAPIPVRHPPSFLMRTCGH